jgi:hypothetical protein
MQSGSPRTLKAPSDHFYDALHLWADRAFTAIHPAVVFIAILACIVIGMEMSHCGWRGRRLWQMLTGLFLTAAAAGWSTIGFLTIRNGGGGVSPKEAFILPYFFAFTGVLALALLSVEVFQHFRISRRKLSPAKGDELPV